jgi:hypothetical protein
MAQNPEPVAIANAAMATVTSLMLSLHSKGILSVSDIKGIVAHASSVLDGFDDPKIKAGADYLRNHPQFKE